MHIRQFYNPLKFHTNLTDFKIEKLYTAKNKSYTREKFHCFCRVSMNGKLKFSLQML